MHKDPVRQMLRYRWAIFGILALAYLFVYFHRLSLSVVANDLVEEFNTSASVMGLLGSIYFYCYAVMQFPAGLLSDSIGPRKTVAAFLLVASVGSILFGLAPNINLAFAGRVLVGFGVSMVFIPTMKILSQWFRPREFASMAGILNAVGGAGVLAATWLLALMTATLGWRLSFQLIGGATFVIVALAWVVVRDRPQDRGWPSILEIDRDEGAPPSPPQSISLMQGARRVVSEPYFWPVAVWFFLDCGIFFGFGALWGGPYLMHVYGLTRAEAGTVLSMIAWGMIVGSPLLGFVSDKILRSRKKPILLCTAVLTLELGFMVFCPEGLPRPVLYLLFFVLSVCASSVVVLGFTTTKELFPVEIAGTSVGTVNLFPFLGGAVFMPFLGRILDGFPKTPAGGTIVEGYSALLLALLIAAAVALCCAVLMKETFQER
jgi:sugar phosphate permease